MERVSMKKILIICLMVVLLPVLACNEADTSSKANKPIESKEQKMSYGIGYRIGKSLQVEDITTLDLDTLERGLRDAYSDKASTVPEKEIEEALMELREEQVAKQQAKGVDNLARADKFIEENAKKDGIKTLKDGLQYRVITSGKGKSPTMEDKVTLHYRGRNLDGKEFDSSYKRGQPAQMSPAGVIPGFSEALQKMKEGDKWEVFIHPNMAYGPNSPGPDIGPNSLLIFELELISVN